MMEPASPPPPRTAGDWLGPGRFALLVGLLILASFPQVLLGLQTFVVRDYGFFAYPLAHFQRECFWRGELPLWNPYNNCGVPFLAQWNTMPLYPPALVYLLLPLEWSLSFFSLAHLFWAGLGMYFLARHWTGNSSAAAVAGVVFAFNGLSLNLLMWPSHIATLSWAPWVIWSVERAWREGGRRLVVAAAVGALQMLAGGPETILLTWLLLALLCARDCRRAIGGQLDSNGEVAGGKAGAARFACRFSGVVLLVAGLAAAQLLPFLDLAAHSQREQGYADTRWSIPAWGWANLLVPMVFGRIWNMGVFFQYHQAWTSSYYLGVGALLLVLLSVWRMRDGRVRLLAAAGLIALLLAFGNQTFVYRCLRYALPQVSLMTYPVKFIILLVLVTPLLAAYAMARLQPAQGDEAVRSRRRICLLAGLLLTLIAAILFWAWKSPFPTDNPAAATRNGLVRVVFLLAAAGLLIASGWTARAGLRRLFLLLLLLLLWLDVWTHVPNQNPTVPTWIYQPDLARTKLAMHPQPALGQSRAMISPAAEARFTQFTVSNPKDNFIVKRLGYFANCNLLDSVPKVNGFFSLYPRECGEINSILYGATNASFPRLADFLSVSQVTAPEEFYQWLPRVGWLPPITGGQRPVFLDDTNALHALTRREFDPRAEVILPSEARSLVAITKQSRVHIGSTQIGNHKIDADVEADEPSLLVISQTWYHPWRAYIDGQPTGLLRANYAFQAVLVPVGKHQVRLVYEDQALHLGVWISVGTVAVCVFIWIRQRRRTAAAALNTPVAALTVE